MSTLSLPLKVLSRGPYSTSTGLMNDTLRTQNWLPATEPYSALLRFAHVGGEVTNPGVFTVTGNNAIVDWVLVELRSAGDPTQILTTRAALVQRDGDVVDMDGVAPVLFANQNPGSYYVALGHRNHLRVMTAAPVTVTGASALVDFTNPNTPTYGNYAQAIVGNVRALWAGDANSDNRVINAGPNNDRNAVLTRVLTDPGNPQGNANYVVTGYGVTDLNLDGKTIAAGPNNEMNVILTTVLTHPGNSSQNANYVVQEQVPAGVLVMPAALSPVSPADYISDMATYVLQDSDFATVVGVAANQVMGSQGLPIPATVAAPTENVGAAGAATTQSSEGWVSLFSTDFVNGFPGEGQNGDCNLTLSAQDTNPSDGVQDYDWGFNAYRSHETSGAAWPFAAGNNGGALNPGSQSYPENQTTRLICTFSGLNSVALKNIMVEFSLWLDAGDPATTETDRGDYFFVGFNTGETTYQGYRWYSTPLDPITNDYWQRYRFFYPELVSKVNSNGGVLKIMWQFTSNGHRIDGARGAWLDNLKVERYVQPSASANCKNLDPQTTVPGVSSASKGLNLPPYAVDNGDRAGQTQRLLLADVDWVRLEFAAQPTMLYLLNAQTPLTPPSIDLKHYDVLIDDLCAHGIATLGLLSYAMVLDRSWEGNGTISAAYLEAYKRQVNLLTDYFSNRIKYWEVWNEPDYAGTQLTTAEYVKLLQATRPIIKEHPNDQVVFGGLGGTDSTAQTFFADVQQALIDSNIYPGPYDVFAIHPYPSGEWRDPNRNNLPKVDPYDYLDEEYPTVLTDFFNIMGATGNSEYPVWVTEIGWNRAAESEQAITLGCTRVNQTMVDRYQQAKYLAEAFDFLLTRPRWNPNKHAIPKVFWYQYGDVGIDLPQSDCTGNGVATASLPASWDASYWAQMTLQQPVVNVDWWYGLYSGTDATITEPQPNLARCTFAKYPNFDTVGPSEIANLDVVEECLPVQVYLPMIQRVAVIQ